MKKSIIYLRVLVFSLMITFIYCFFVKSKPYVSYYDSEKKDNNWIISGTVKVNKGEIYILGHSLSFVTEFYPFYLEFSEKEEPKPWMIESDAISYVTKSKWAHSKGTTNFWVFLIFWVIFSLISYGIYSLTVTHTRNVPKINRGNSETSK